MITAASYGDAEVARALIEAGADLEARASDDAGGVPGADRSLPDDEGRTPLDLCRLGDTPGHHEVEAILTTREATGRNGT